MSDLQLYQKLVEVATRDLWALFCRGEKPQKYFVVSICPANSSLRKECEYFVLAQQAIATGLPPFLRCRLTCANQCLARHGHPPCAGKSVIQ